MAITTHKIKNKKNKEKITMLTCYDYQTALILDEALVDILLVGDSLGNVVLGYADTTMVTMDDMVHHTRAVARGTKNAMVVADMPFLSYHLCIEKTLENAGRLIQAGAKAVKLEGGTSIVPQVKALIEAGIPVVGHLGLTPQSVNQLGGYFIQGKTAGAANKMIEDALAIETAGAFLIVLECIPSELAKIISQKVNVPTIGIGAGVDCDGQVLVVNDMIGLTGGKPNTFVKRFANVNDVIKQATLQYIAEVKDSKYPASEHAFHSDEIKGVY